MPQTFRPARMTGDLADLEEPDERDLPEPSTPRLPKPEAPAGAQTSAGPHVSAGAGNGAGSGHGWRQGMASTADLTEGPIGLALLKLAAPLSLGFIVNAVYSWINMYFVSRLGDTATAALGFSDQFNLVIFTLGSGFGIGSGIVIARRIGERRTRQASLIATQAFSFMALYSSVGAVALYFVIPPLLRLLGLEGATLAYTESYMLTVLIGFPGNLLTFQANSSIRSTGNTIFPMAVAIISALVNAVLDPILIFGLGGMPKLGVQGAAIATATAQWSAAIISTYALYTGKLNFRLYRPTVRFDRDIIRGIFKVGFPSSLQTLAVSIARVSIISIANLFGTAAAAAYTIGLRVDILVMMPIFATGIAIETLVSQNIGARRFDRVKKFRAKAIQYLGMVVGTLGVAIYIFAERLADVFTADPHVAELTVRYLHIAVPGYLCFVIGTTAIRSLSGAGHSLRGMTLVTMVLAFQVPLAFTLAKFTPLHETGVFVGISVSYLVMAVVGSLAVRGEKWMMKRV